MVINFIIGNFLSVQPTGPFRYPTGIDRRGDKTPACLAYTTANVRSILKKNVRNPLFQIQTDTHVCWGEIKTLQGIEISTLTIEYQMSITVGSRHRDNGRTRNNIRPSFRKSFDPDLCSKSCERKFYILRNY